jgi:hypothetical protein
VELTIENVLDGQVVAPPPMFQRDTEPPISELEYSPGLIDVPAPYWDDLSENHDPDRSVNNVTIILIDTVYSYFHQGGSSYDRALFHC